ncbi:MAG: TIGR04141 family sporadically distributed protein, partial [Pseudomonadota bacterium]
MDKEKNIVHLSICLVKEAITRRDQIIKDGYDGPAEIAISGSGKGYLYWKAPHPEFPKWTSLFEDSMDIKQIGKAAGVSAAFVLKADGRYFVLTFGQGGRFLIEDDVCEERFGLLVALNSVDRESFRCVDKQSLDAIQSHTRIQSGEETTADQFGLDVEQDMLKAIVGAPKDSQLGNRMTGTDSLSVSVRMDLSDLPNLLRLYKEKYEQDLSKTDYDWVNNISVVKSSSALVTVFEEGLIEKFAKKDYSNLWLAIPEIIDWNLVSGFIYAGGKGILNPDIDLQGFLSILKGQPVSIDLLKHRHVHCADADHKYVFKHWPIYKCL